MVRTNKISAGLLMFRFEKGKLEVLLAHPGGPFFRNKHDGHWSIPKGEPDESENNLLETAKREFNEETGIEPKAPEYIPLGTILQKGGKTVHAWAFEGTIEPGFQPKSNTFKTEWPPKSGKQMLFSEIDRIDFFSIIEAKKKIKSTQIDFIERLKKYLEEKHINLQVKSP
jgi:predicted NUDIX family NTP pyrophosphohydrolase